MTRKRLGDVIAHVKQKMKKKVEKIVSNRLLHSSLKKSKKSFIMDGTTTCCEGQLVPKIVFVLFFVSCSKAFNRFIVASLVAALQLLSLPLSPHQEVRKYFKFFSIKKNYEQSLRNNSCATSNRLSVEKLFFLPIQNYFRNKFSSPHLHRHMKQNNDFSDVTWSLRVHFLKSRKKNEFIRQSERVRCVRKIVHRTRRKE